MDFKLVSPFTANNRRDFDVAAPQDLRATSANPLVLGEWMELNSAYQTIRGAASPALVPSWPVFAENGRYDTQALGKVPVLFLGTFEADTKIFDSTGITTVGHPLAVGNVTIGGLTKRGLVDGSVSGLVVGYVTRLPANNSGYLRFVRTLS